MTKETFEKAKQLLAKINAYDDAVNSFDKALIEQTEKTSYTGDTLNVDIYNGNGKSTTVYVPRELVITMLNSAVGQYRAKIYKLQAELDAL